MSVPSNIEVTWDGPDAAGAFRAYAVSGGRTIGSAVALPDAQASGAWVISYMTFDDPEHYDSLGHALLNRLVEQIEHESPLGTSTVITGSLDNIRFRDAIEAYGPRITYQRG